MSKGRYDETFAGEDIVFHVGKFLFIAYFGGNFVSNGKRQTNTRLGRLTFETFTPGLLFS